MSKETFVWFDVTSNDRSKPITDDLVDRCAGDLWGGNQLHCLSQSVEGKNKKRINDGVLTSSPNLSNKKKCTDGREWILCVKSDMLLYLLRSRI